MYKDINQLKKDMAKVTNGSKAELEQMKKEIANKAEKEMLLDNEKLFFKQLGEINERTDKHLTSLVSDEMRKVTEQFSYNSKILDKKFAHLYKDLDIEKMNRMVERKMGKEEAIQRFDGND
jgi:hypothetical protein